MPTDTLTRDQLAAVASALIASGVSLAGPLTATPIAGGRSNLTYHLTDSAAVWVLRMPPRAGRTPSAHDVAREHRVTSALAGTGVPVPPPVLLCEDDSVAGGPFAVAGYVSGSSVQTAADLRALSDDQITGTVAALTATLAALHRLDHVEIGLERLARPDAYSERQLKRWAGQWRIVGTAFPRQVQASARSLVAALSERLPRQASTGIVHGDYRIDNTLLTLDREPTVAAVVDWELSTIGDPVADVAMMCVYRHSGLDQIVGVPTAWTSSRIPDAARLASEYESAGGVPLVDFDEHLALGYLKLAVIAAGIDHRYRAGANDGPGYDTAGQAVPTLLEAGRAALVRWRPAVL